MTDKLTIFHINTEMSFRGGEIQTLHLIRALNQRGHRNLLIARPGAEILQQAEKTNIACLPLNMRGEWDWIAARKMNHSIEEYHPEILHAHTAHACSIALMARRKRLNLKIVYTRRVSFTGPLLARKLQKVDAVIAVSETIRKILLKTGVSEKIVFVAESGTDFSQFDSAPDRQTISSELKIPFDAFVIGNVSYFKPEKGQEQLIRVFCNFGKENSYLLLIGDGPTRGHCEQIARETPCAERILFTGYREDAFRFYSAMDVFFFSSSKGEGWSGVLREAMGAKVPVIAVRQDSTEEQVDSGLLVSNDEQQWLDALNRLYQNPALRKELAEAAFTRAKKYTIDSMAAKTEECYYRIAR